MSSTLEVLAVLTGVAYALLAVRRNRWAWAFGGVSSALLAWLAADAALPLQSALQTLYVGMAVYGFRHWSKSGGGDPPVQRWPWRHHAVATAVIVTVALSLSPSLVTLTGASWPRLDAAVTVASLLATWMTARTILENWWYWFAVNAASMFLYSVQGLHFVALLYFLYFVIAVFGLRAWQARWREAGKTHDP